ncbi:primosomal protein N' [Rhodospirillaceae bacterium KN72]|uniref:Replication restart protein PriA n=1 Tax=Pacificispira spongiicola TaxID=2729598 RepID=A0A7Y0E1Y4_9PROT|nr:primosomal protein N' [Pacificispira spongiicola]NMM45745.1 primosomal protein N' [Pacificispira spongiicola]
MTSDVSPSQPLSLFPPARRVKVLLPLPLDSAYDYAVPEGMDVGPGSFVTVPLGGRQIVGIVWDDEPDPDGVPESKLRPVAGVVPVPPLPEASRRFVDRMAAYTLAPPGQVLRMAMSSPKALEPASERTVYTAADPAPKDLRWTSARRRVYALAQEDPPRSAADLAREAGVSSGVVRGLADAGGLLPMRLPDSIFFETPDPDHPRAALSDAQQNIAEEMSRAVLAGGFSVTLLDGVTGSGKTEVYFEAVAAALGAGKKVLVLLPEIALSAQWLERFEERFGTLPAEWHSDLSPGTRRRTWKAVAEGRVQILVGARSALHLPFPDLGLIVVDEEHDGSYKQEEGVIYHARDMAVLRAQISDCPIILASATPSLESLANVEAQRYRLAHLPERHGEAELPQVSLVDLRKTPPPRQRWIAPPLQDALEETLAKGEQALLFLNRRGYAPLTLCRTCGHRIECPDCDAWLVEHRFGRRLECHHCGFSMKTPEKCPSCGDEGSLVACGPGVERLFEEAVAILPEARIEVVTSDTLQGPLAAAAFVDRVTSGEVNLIIGTQIVAKGYHFPLLTLVGVVDADLGLAGGDLRASERTFQLLSQVAGRAGRAGHKGRVLLQTANPNATVLRAIADGDRDGFYAAEADMRRDLGWPPYGKLAAIIVSGEDEGHVERTAGDLARSAPRLDNVRVLGPAAPPLALLRGRHRRRLLLKADRTISIQRVLSDWMSRIKPPSSVRVQIDIDPYSFM